MCTRTLASMQLQFGQPKISNLPVPSLLFYLRRPPSPHLPAFTKVRSAGPGNSMRLSWLGLVRRLGCGRHLLGVFLLGCSERDGLAATFVVWGNLGSLLYRDELSVRLTAAVQRVGDGIRQWLRCRIYHRHRIFHRGGGDRGRCGGELNGR